MNKPISLIKEDFKNNIINAINNSNIPLFLIEYILKDILNEVHNVAANELERDKKTYEEALQKENEAEKDLNK